jgi:hypothetical protein
MSLTRLALHFRHLRHFGQGACRRRSAQTVHAVFGNQLGSAIYGRGSISACWIHCHWKPSPSSRITLDSFGNPSRQMMAESPSLAVRSLYYVTDPPSPTVKSCCSVRIAILQECYYFCYYSMPSRDFENEKHAEKPTKVVHPAGLEPATF